MRLAAWLERLLFFVSLQAHIHCLEVFGILGEDFAFPVKIDQKMDEIIWTKNKDKVVEWERQNKPTYFTSFQNRALLNTETGCLTIFNLEKNDTGTYILEYLDSVKKTFVFHHHTFILSVLDPPSEPEISCNISGDDLVLRCTADFQKPLTYIWKFSNKSVTSQTEEIFVSKKNVDASEKVACFIKFSQTEKSSEISFTQCLGDQKGDSYHRRSRDGLIASILLFLGVGIVAFLFIKALSLQAVDDENERPEAGKKLMARDNTSKDKQMVNGVNWEGCGRDHEDSAGSGVEEREEKKRGSGPPKKRGSGPPKKRGSGPPKKRGSAPPKKPEARST